MTGNVFFGNSVNKVFDHVQATADNLIGILDNMLNNVENISTALNQSTLVDYTAPNIDFDSYRDAINQFKNGTKMIDEVKDQVGVYEGYRYFGTWIYFVIIGGAMLAYFIFACLLLGWLTYFLTVLFWLFTIINWIVFALFLPLSVAMSDGCYELDIIIDTDNKDSYINQMIQCVDSSSSSSFIADNNALRDGSLLVINYDATMIHYQQSSFPYAWTVENVTVSNINVSSLVFFDDSWLGYGVNVTQYIQEARRHFNAITSLDNLLTDIEIVQSCSFVTEAIQGMRNILCIDVIMSVDLMTFAMLGAGILSWILIPLGIKAKKRYKKANSLAVLSLKQLDDAEMDQYPSGVMPSGEPNVPQHRSSHSSYSSYEDGYETRHPPRQTDNAAAAPPPYAVIAAASSPVSSQQPTDNRPPTVMPSNNSGMGSQYAPAQNNSQYSNSGWAPQYSQPASSNPYAAPAPQYVYAQPGYVDNSLPMYAQAPSAPILTVSPEDMKLVDACNDDGVNQLNARDVE
jgi:hypothetical protein